MTDCNKCLNFDACNDLTRKEEDMYALVEATCHRKSVTLRDLFRAAYMKKFSKDIPQNSLEEDLHQFRVMMNTPGYVVDLMLATYGPM